MDTHDPPGATDISHNGRVHTMLVRAMAECRYTSMDTHDPPDATDDAAGFMTDISHNAWKRFTEHIAQEGARPASLSSLNTGRQAHDSVAHEVRELAVLNWVAL